MSTLSRIVCALALLLVLAAQVFAYEGESQVNQMRQPLLVDEGPNAGLSNEELVSEAPGNLLDTDLLTPPRNPTSRIKFPMITRDEMETASLHIWVSTDATPLVRRTSFDATSKGTAGESVISPFLGVAFSPDSKLLAGVQMGALGGGQSGRQEDPDKILVWDLSTPGSLPTKLYVDGVRNAAFSPDGKVLAGTGSRELYLWDTSKLNRPSETLPKLNKVLSIPGNVSLPAMAFSPDGKMLGATGSEDGLYIWDAPFTGQAQLAIREQAGALAFSPDNRTLATSGSGGLRLYSLDDLKAPPRVLEGPKPASGGPGDYRSDWLAFSPDGQLLASGWNIGGGQEPGELHVWDLRNTQEPIASFPGGTMVAFSPDGKLLATAGSRIWEVARLVSEGSKASTIYPEGMCGNNIAFSPDGLKLAVACYEASVQLWGVSDFPNMGKPALLRSDPTTVSKITSGWEALTAITLIVGLLIVGMVLRKKRV